MVIRRALGRPRRRRRRWIVVGAFVAVAILLIAAILIIKPWEPKQGEGPTILGQMITPVTVKLEIHTIAEFEIDDFFATMSESTYNSKDKYYRLTHGWNNPDSGMQFDDNLYNAYLSGEESSSDLNDDGNCHIGLYSIKTELVLDYSRISRNDDGGYKFQVCDFGSVYETQALQQTLPQVWDGTGYMGGTTLTQVTQTASGDHLEALEEDYNSNLWEDKIADRMTLAKGLVNWSDNNYYQSRWEPVLDRDGNVVTYEQIVDYNSTARPDGAERWEPGEYIGDVGEGQVRKRGFAAADVVVNSEYNFVRNNLNWVAVPIVAQIDITRPLTGDVLASHQSEIFLPCELPWSPDSSHAFTTDKGSDTFNSIVNSHSELSSSMFTERPVICREFSFNLFTPFKYAGAFLIQIHGTDTEVEKALRVDTEERSTGTAGSPFVREPVSDRSTYIEDMTIQTGVGSHIRSDSAEDYWFQPGIVREGGTAPQKDRAIGLIILLAVIVVAVCIGLYLLYLYLSDYPKHAFIEEGGYTPVRDRLNNILSVEGDTNASEDIFTGVG